MTKDRLSEIWGRFSAGTRSKASLSGASVEYTIRPERRERPHFVAPDEMLRRAAGEDPRRARTADRALTDPVAAALSALQTRLADKRSGRGAPPPPISLPEDEIAAQILADMKATEARTARRPGDYIAYAAARQAAFARRKRKKILGLF